VSLETQKIIGSLLAIKMECSPTKKLV